MIRVTRYVLRVASYDELFATADALLFTRNPQPVTRKITK
jgi:hypothetical protein